LGSFTSTQESKDIMGYSVRRTIEEDCGKLSTKVRPEDVQELWSSHRSTPKESLELGMKESGDFCFSLFLNEDIVGIFGVNRVDNKSGVVWLIGSSDITSSKSGFYKVSKKYLKMFRQEFDFLFNYIDDRNRKTSEWLEKLGFSFIHQELEFGVDKTPFNLFMIER
tara:strand:- start:948 stop:1445 length:498 start_codon:yes stop_codon:yes gene_type:complete